MKRHPLRILLIGIFLIANSACTVTAEDNKKDPSQTKKWRRLFDGKSLKGWKLTNFGGEGPVEVKNGRIEMDFGSSMTGITYDGKLPKTDYEVSLEAMKVDGTDFFCALTFPVGDSHCSLVGGGWAGAVVGLSSIDGRDASENDTTRYMTFKPKKWYTIRVRVTPVSIQAWIDGKRVVNQNIEGKTVSTRNEVVLSKPLGVSAWETRSALREIKIRPLARSAPKPQTARGKDPNK